MPHRGAQQPAVTLHAFTEAVVDEKTIKQTMENQRAEKCQSSRVCKVLRGHSYPAGMQKIKQYRVRRKSALACKDTVCIDRDKGKGGRGGKGRERERERERERRERERERERERCRSSYILLTQKNCCMEESFLVCSGPCSSLQGGKPEQKPREAINKEGDGNLKCLLAVMGYPSICSPIYINVLPTTSPSTI